MRELAWGKDPDSLTTNIRGGKNTKKIHTKKKKNHLDPDNHDGVITHLEPDILECGKVGLRKHHLQTKLVEVMEFQLSYFKS